MITTTLQKIQDADACKPRYKHLREALGLGFGMTTELPLTRILETNGREDVLWALDNAVEGGDKILSLWAADCAAHVQHIWLAKYPNDQRPAKAIKAARQFARGEITAAAGDAARAAAGAAAGDAAGAAAVAAAWAAAWAAAGAAAWDAARAAAWAAAGAAAWDAARAAAWDAAWAAAWDAARDAGGAAEEEWQTQHLIAYLKDEVTEDWSL